jgi:formiminotetrahydrofolate cyclodeaminase
MAGLPEPSLSELLAGLAAPTPAPGAGSATGWTCAHAAALVEMTAGITLARPDAEPTRERMVEIAAQARALRARSVALAEADLGAYAPVLTALRVPREDPSRAAQLEAALSQASETPLELAAVGAELAALAAEVAGDGAAGVRGDALAAVLIAEAACQAAARLVAINLGRRPEDSRIAESARHAERASELRARVLEGQRH